MPPQAVLAAMRLKSCPVTKWLFHNVTRESQSINFALKTFLLYASSLAN